MGKVKQVVMGDIEAEEKARAKAAEKRAQKKIVKNEEKVEEKVEVVSEAEAPEVVKTEVKAVKASKSGKPNVSGKNYQAQLTKIDKNKLYSPAEAVSLVKKIAFAKFNETIELHINVLEKGIRGNATLPNGTGKQVKVVIATDGLVTDIEKGGKINFDILVASPDMMPKLAKIAKILGPRGLMPNPKTNTISPQPEKLVKDLSGGQIQYKTETNFPIIHTIIGKLDFEDKKLLDNYQVLIKAIGKDKIVSLFLKSTMSPAIGIQV